MPKFPASSQTIPWCTILLCIICVALYALVPFDSNTFYRLTLTKSAPFEPIRWLTGNLLHSDLNHFLWNIGPLAVLGYFIENYSRKLWLLTVLCGFMGSTVWFFIQNQFQQYVGLSGSLNTLLVVCLFYLRTKKHWFHGNTLLWFILVLSLAKNIYEFFTGEALMTQIRWTSAPSFHLVGMFIGLLVIFTWEGLRRFTKGNTLTQQAD